MVRKLIAYLLLCLPCSHILLAMSPDSLPKTTDGLLKLLNEEIERRYEYVAKPLQRIDSIHKVINTTTDPKKMLDLYEALGDQYDGVNADSAILYFTRGVDMGIACGDSVLAQRCLFKRCLQLTIIGAAKECIDQIKSAEDSGIYPENRYRYYATGRFVYYNLAVFYPYRQSVDTYLSLGLPYAKGCLELTEPNTPEQELNKALIHHSLKQSILHIAALNDVIALSTSLDRNFVQASTLLGEAYMAAGKETDAINAFAAAAIANIRNADRHGTALMRLGMVLYSKGDIKSAYRYLATALDNTVMGCVRMNSSQISQALAPVQNDIHVIERNRFISLVSLIAVLLILLGFIVFLILKQRREVIVLKTMKKRLSSANMVKETYITEFLNLCSANMEKTEEFSRLCRRKITAGQSEELLHYIKSGKVSEEQRNIFYSIFDDAFIHIFPTFIADVNSLLQSDKQLTTMNTELRILAFTRLGMDDTTRIARFLGLSLNTIYTYRNKLRNKAINRETFESDVMKIGQIA